jgi:hypothetical protein
MWHPLRAVTLALLLLLARDVRAIDGRDFVGTYSYQALEELGERSIRIALTLGVFNHSGGDVRAATVGIDGGFLLGRPYGTFAPVDVPDAGRASLTGEVVLDRVEYDHWTAGGHPTVWIEFGGSGGVTIRQLVELIP